MNPFARKVVWAAAGLGVITFLLGLLLQAFTGDVFGEVSPGTDSYSTSLVGHRGLVEWLGRTGLVVLRARDRGQVHTSRAFPLLLLEPWAPTLEGEEAPLGMEEDRDPAQEARRVGEQVRRILEAGQGAGMVVLSLPKWAIEPSPTIRGWIEARTPLHAGHLQGMVEALGLEELEVVRSTGLNAPETSLFEEGGPVTIDIQDPVQLVRPTSEDLDIEPLVWSEEGILVGLVTVPDLEVPLVIISDPDLLNNQGLGRGDHAALIHGMLVGWLGAQGVVMDESLHGFGQSGALMRWAFRFPTVVVVVHGILLLALVGWSLAVRFGKILAPPPVLPPGNELLIGNTAQLLAWAGDHADAARRYASECLMEVARRYSLASGLSSGSRVPLESLERLTRSRGLKTDLRKLLGADRSQAMSASEALRIARRAHAWRVALLEGGDAHRRESWKRS